MASPICITVYGKPQQRGSKRMTPQYDRDGKPRRDKRGRPILLAKDDNPKSESWMQECRAAARTAYRGELLRGFLAVTLTFYFLRPTSHLGTGRNAGTVKVSAPLFPTLKDVDKLARAVNDSLSGIVYVDDRFIADQELKKRYGEPERVEIVIRQLTAGVVAPVEKQGVLIP